MKHFVLCLGFFLSLSTFAADLSGDLNLERLGENTNAGRYNVAVHLVLKSEAEVIITQKMMTTPTRRCLTEFTIDAGVVNLTLSDAQRSANTETLSQKLLLKAYDDSLNETCAPKTIVNGRDFRYDAYISYNDELTLKYPAPAGYGPMRARFSVFPFGYSVSLHAEERASEHFVIAQSDQQLRAQINRGLTDGLQYEVRASKGGYFESLGLGFIALR